MRRWQSQRCRTAPTRRATYILNATPLPEANPMAGRPVEGLQTGTSLRSTATTDGHILGPGLGLQRALRLDRRSDCVGRRGKCHVETIALGPHSTPLWALHASRNNLLCIASVSAYVTPSR